jgi:hypothetical protein
VVLIAVVALGFLVRRRQERLDAVPGKRRRERLEASPDWHFVPRFAQRSSERLGQSLRGHEDLRSGWLGRRPGAIP